ncbi:PhoH family protein [Porphyromonas crevioricanis]|uniref:PhoH-like protein n=2 Tax=Porphyromonas crevioricanis TaxID=393921 RepID=A0A2X4PM55_9PORP|nr:PhoH family protein [Porphyromonas crevioricanis]GAD05870.1 predicted ATPase related to phosphate starvation-inducible protein PhoH [Porphyromonas crevioricanis JCM 15906]GAD07980.1 predicted ATPase related to phosphate starvation-inducible protein PhoH [Porphyromonas crevioricanis JCM 13913]SJZ82682.1 PhoH-like ATPase [Porphyromonas crevioricanis]SQH72608.1 PhoH-like protein [Porphyromonas crevioricanis]
MAARRINKSPKRNGSKKIFVLDTNVILHDYDSIDKFEENDIYIPIVVLEELDKFKRGSEQINFNARQFVRKLDELSDQDLFASGVSLGEGRGRLFVYVRGQKDERVTQAFRENIPDHRILSITFSIAEEHPEVPTILVTKDVNLRMKAKSLGIVAEDYISDKVENVDHFALKEVVYEGVSGELIDRIYATPRGIPVQNWEMGEKLEPNHCFLMKSERNSVLARYNPFTDCIEQIEKHPVMGVQPRNAEQAFALEILKDPDIKLVGLSGKAGTGKTLLALAAALDQADEYEQVLLARPIVSLANKDLGFLPGDEKAKVAPYMQPLFDNLNVIKFQLSNKASELRKIEDMQKENRLVIEALAFIRGRSLAKTICIIDEAQNLTPQEVKTIITRAGEGTKMIFTGDVHQIDSPYLDMQSNGLAYMIDKMKGQKLFAHVNLVKGERSELSELASDLL